MSQDTETTKTFSVNLWGSHPEDNNDDCWTGADFASLQEALEVFDAPETHFSRSTVQEAAFIEIDGPKVYNVRRNPSFVPSKDDDFDEELRREIANEAGMLHGCDGYNEVMGY